jgi:AhpD family alkylhydroperoxidase
MDFSAWFEVYLRSGPANIPFGKTKGIIYLTHTAPALAGFDGECRGLTNAVARSKIGAPILPGGSVMKTLLASAGLALLLAIAVEPSVSAQEIPEPFKLTLPDGVAKLHWDEQLAIMNAGGALDAKTKHLIGLAVAAQIPCTYCVFTHTKIAKANGATDAQIKEAIATAALARFNSTILQGSDGGREWQPPK